MSQREDRRQRIRDVLARNRVHSQQELHDLLWAESVQTTQATLSRDLRDMGVTKGVEGYELPPAVGHDAGDTRGLEQSLKSARPLIQQAGSLVVLRTRPSGGPSLALAIEAARLRHVVGTIAGESTVFIATHSVSQSGELLRLLRKLTGRV